MNNRDKAAIAISLLAGGGDFTTGCLLALAPEWTLARMGVSPAPGILFLRFVGVFVACVGLSYGLGLLAWAMTGRRQRLRFAWELTILFRLAAGGFVAMQILSGALPWAWASVPAADGFWALIQGIGLRAGWLNEGRW
jgi:hypothetical protein